VLLGAGAKRKHDDYRLIDIEEGSRPLRRGSKAVASTDTRFQDALRILLHLSYIKLRVLCFRYSSARGNPMGIVYPSKAVARRWDGALQATLRRAPVEAFLRARSLLPAPAGVSQETDNLVRATVFIVEAGLNLYIADRQGGLALAQQSELVVAVCLVSMGLAQQFAQAAVWRTVALVSSAQLLSPCIGLNSAALLSAGVVRQFQQELKQGISPLDWRITTSAREAVSHNRPELLLEASAHIATRLKSEPSAAELSPTEDLRALHQIL
jgi:hypothetical protein